MQMKFNIVEEISFNFSNKYHLPITDNIVNGWSTWLHNFTTSQMAQMHKIYKLFLLSWEPFLSYIFKKRITNHCFVKWVCRLRNEFHTNKLLCPFHVKLSILCNYAICTNLSSVSWNETKFHHNAKRMRYMN